MCTWRRKRNRVVFSYDDAYRMEFERFPESKWASSRATRGMRLCQVELDSVQSLTMFILFIFLLCLASLGGWLNESQQTKSNVVIAINILQRHFPYRGAWFHQLAHYEICKTKQNLQCYMLIDETEVVQIKWVEIKFSDKLQTHCLHRRLLENKLCFGKAVLGREILNLSWHHIYL